MDGRILHELVNQRASVSMYPAKVAEGQAVPFAFYLRSDHSMMSVKGSGPVGESTTWQITCVGSSFSEVSTMAASIRTGIDNFSGSITTGVAPSAITTALSIVRVEDETDDSDDESGYYIKTLTVKIIILY